jgi:Rab guanine nucleotide exchange factor SEC2
MDDIPSLPNPHADDQQEKAETGHRAEEPVSDADKKEDIVRVQTPSSEEFATPRDDLSAAPLSRQVSQQTSQSVENTPGPEPAPTDLLGSSSQTPVQAAFPPDVQDSKDADVSVAPPPRHATPTPDVLPSRSDSPSIPVRPPSRGGSASPAPPPIPRRAAARGARPLSTIATAAPITAEDAKEAEAKEGIKIDDAKLNAEAAPASAPQEHAIADSEPPTLDPSTADDTRASETSKAQSSDDEATVTEVAAIPDEKEKEVMEALAANGMAEHTMDATNTSEGKAAPPANDTSTPVVESTIPEPRKEIPQVREKNEDDADYVGDTTWEERAWKELTRLREDMFWARIGGVR